MPPRKGRKKRQWRDGLLSGVGEFREVVLLGETRASNSDGSWAVVEGMVGCERVALSGEALAAIPSGERRVVVGEWASNPKWGPSVKVTSLEMPPRDDLESLLINLEAQRVKHLGPARLEALVEMYGADVYEVVDAGPEEALAALPGMNESRAREAAVSWEKGKPMRAIRALLPGQESLARRIFESWGEEAVDKVRENPYRLIAMRGVSFLTADEIAIKAGFPLDSPLRRKAAVLHVLGEAEKQGHCYLPVQEILKRVRKIYARRRDDARLQIVVDDPILLTLADEGLIVNDAGGKVYRRHIYRRERSLAEEIARLTNHPGHRPYRETHLDRSRTFGGLTLDGLQLDGIAQAMAHPVSIITGPPGSGKSTLVRGIVEVAGDADIGGEIELVAYTNRAAARLAETTGIAASTIHKTLGWRPGEQPIFDASNKLTANLVIVDESSMVPLDAMEMLVSAMRDGTHLVLVGDVDQLPSVGGGRVFGDMIESQVLPVVRLEKIVRQADNSMTRRAAQAIRQKRLPSGEYGPAEKLEGLHRDFFLRYTDEMEEQVRIDALHRHEANGGDWTTFTEPSTEARLDPVVDRIVNDACVGLPAYAITEAGGYTAAEIDVVRDMQVFSPQYGGPLGVDNLNILIRERLNPRGQIISGLKRPSGKELRVGDKVIETVSGTESGLANSEMAIILEDHPEMMMLTLERLDDSSSYQVSYASCSSLRLGYVITVHKAQGCESKMVVCVVHSAHQILLDRHLVYTAITRAKPLCCVIGDRRGMRLSVERAQSGERHTALDKRLQGEIATRHGRTADGSLSEARVVGFASA